MKKLSTVQIDVLTEMAKGLRLFSVVHGSCRLERPKDSSTYLGKKVHRNTLGALVNRGLIIKTEGYGAGPWYQRDYRITDLGRQVLEEQS